MHEAAVVEAVLDLHKQGLGARRISRNTGLPLSTVRDWVAGRVPGCAGASAAGARCRACGHVPHRFAELPGAYVYPLGLYLGDGCVSAHPRGVHRLRIFLDLRYPGIIGECEAAMSEVLPASRVGRLDRAGNYTRRPEPTLVELYSYSKAWPCLLPQHGPGRKHQREIHLAAWQEELVRRDPGPMLRGLVHSDGSRFVNTGRNWSAPRYSFRNRSEDIRRILSRRAGCWAFARRSHRRRPTSRARRTSPCSIGSSGPSADRRRTGARA